MPRKAKRGVKRSLSCSCCGKTQIVPQLAFQSKSSRHELCSEKCRNEYMKAYEKCSCASCDRVIRNISIQVNSNQFCSNACATQFEKAKKRPSTTNMSISTNFNWDDYIKDTNSVAAPRACFKQSKIIPKNEFAINMNLEVEDPRNLKTLCIATVKSIVGCRIRLRLNGTDNSNDFYRLVDSEDIHPLGYSDQNEIMLQPPLGFKLNSISWKSFLAKAKANAVPAPESAFKQVPPKPMKNFFEIGHKIEAVDIKHPHLICPATVSDIKKDKIHVTFDGYSGGFDYWCSYDSRDIFPVGWCERSGHTLQPPGNLVRSISNATASHSKNVSNVNDNKMENNIISSQMANIATGSGTSRASPPHITVHVHKNTCDNKYVSLSSLPDTIREIEPLSLCKNILEELIRCSINVSELFSRLDGILTGEQVAIIYSGTVYKLNAPVFSDDSPAKIQFELKQFFLNIDTAIQACIPLFNIGEHTNSCITKCLTHQRVQPSRRTIPSSSNAAVPALSPQRTSQVSRLQNSCDLSNKPVCDWSIEDVIRYITIEHPPLETYARNFRDNEIDGKAFMLITPEIALHYMELKLGPALKVCSMVNELKRRRR